MDKLKPRIGKPEAPPSQAARRKSEPRLDEDGRHKPSSRRLPDESKRLPGGEAPADAAGVGRKAPSGLTLTKKFSLAITFVSAVIALASGLVINIQASKAVKDEIFKQGIAAVKLSESLGRALIAANFKGDEENHWDLKKKVDLAKKDLRLENLFDNSTPGLVSVIKDARLTILDGDKESDILSFSPKGGGSDTYKLQTDRTIVSPDGKDRDGISILEGVMTDGKEESDIYEFRKDFDLSLPVAGEERYRPKKARIHVMLSSDKISELEQTLFLLTIGILAISIGVSLLVANRMAAGITMPIYQLVEDMSIVAKGDLDHKTLPRSADEVGFLAATFNKLTRDLKDAHKAELAQEKIKHELQVGHDIQQILLPKSCMKIPGYDAHSFYLAANELGGDYYDFIVADKTHLGIVVADVSGKGIPASIYMTIMRTVLNIAAVGNLSCVNCLARTNRFLSDRIKRGMFVTACYAILDCKNHVLRVSSAGHNPMVLYRKRTNNIEKVKPSGIALGFDKGPLFERMLKEAEVALEPGDRFVLYTDGVVECMDENRQEFTDQRFHDFVKANTDLDSTTFVNKLVKELKRHQGKAPQHDDITIVTFRKL